MKYINSIKGGLISLIIFIFLTLFIPGVGPSEDIQLILTITTFLFAILVGFFISRSASRFNEMRESVAKEDALFLSFYKASQVYGKVFSQKIGDLIDKYYIIAYDHELSKYYYKENMSYFLQMWDETVKLKSKKQDGDSTLFSILKELEESRNLSSSVASEKINLGQWSLLSILAGIILFCLFYLKANQTYSIIITILLSTSLIIILLILRDLQNLKFGEEAGLLEESGQEVFEAIGKLRYYNEKYFKKGYYNPPEKVKKFRLGLHHPGEKMKIKIVERK